MQTSELVIAALANVNRTTNRVLNGLSQMELSWCPTKECNPIGFLFFHMARFEDGFLLNMVLGKPQLWASKKWYKKFNMPVEENAGHYTAEQIAKFKVPDIKNLTTYAEEVRSELIQVLQLMDASQMDRIVKAPWGNASVGSLLAMAITHQAEHAGEMSYIRGIQKGINK